MCKKGLEKAVRVYDGSRGGGGCFEDQKALIPRQSLGKTA